MPARLVGWLGRAGIPLEMPGMAKADPGAQATVSAAVVAKTCLRCLRLKPSPVGCFPRTPRLCRGCRYISRPFKDMIALTGAHLSS